MVAFKFFTHFVLNKLNKFLSLHISLNAFRFRLPTSKINLNTFGGMETNSVGLFFFSCIEIYLLLPYVQYTNGNLVGHMRPLGDQHPPSVPVDEFTVSSKQKQLHHLFLLILQYVYCI